MNIKDFLIENYIWILIIILITIVTIIGFLADKKKITSKKEKESKIKGTLGDNSVTNDNNITPIQYNPQEMPMQNQMYNNNASMNNQQQLNQFNNIPNNQNMNNNLNNMNINNMIPTQQMTSMMVNNNEVNNRQPVETIIPNINQESMYRPLQDQQTVVAPMPVPNYENSSNNNPEIVNQMNNLSQPMQPIYNQPMPVQDNKNSEPMMNTIPNYNEPVPMMSQPNTNFNNGNFSAYNQNNITNPEPINYIPTPQPVNPQPIMPGINNNVQLNQPNFNNQPQTMMQQPNFNQPQPMMPQQPNQINNQPVSFVFGPQNNGQNM